MNEIVALKVEEYMYGLLPQRDQVLNEIEALAESRAIPIVGPAAGRVLLQLAKMIDARHIFEMGSAVGYSTIWLARGAGRDGVVYYTDTGEENARQAAAYFKRAGVDDKVRLLIGDAIHLIDTVEGDFDIIFIDLIWTVLLIASISISLKYDIPPPKTTNSIPNRFKAVAIAIPIYSPVLFII